ncbi:hypothetical protein QUC31_010223 [Theobroma cacao]
MLKVMSLWKSDCEGHLLMLCKLWLAMKSFLCMVRPPNNTESAKVVYHSIIKVKNWTIASFLWILAAVLMISHLESSSVKIVVVLKFVCVIVRDSLINVGPLKDFSYGLRINADANATGIAKQIKSWLMFRVCCSGHGKTGALCVLGQSIRPEMITEVEPTGCKGIWTVYHKSTRSHSADLSEVTDDEYHAYLIISLEARTMVLEAAHLLTEVTESIDYYVQGRTIAAGNLLEDGTSYMVCIYMEVLSTRLEIIFILQVALLLLLAHKMTFLESLSSIRGHDRTYLFYNA